MVNRNKRKLNKVSIQKIEGCNVYFLQFAPNFTHFVHLEPL
jgi:hypothetical protein